MKKRVLSILLACLLALTAAACGSNAPDAKQEGQDAAQGTESAPSDETEESSVPPVEPKKDEPALDWSAVEPAPEEEFDFYGTKVSGNKGVAITEYLGEGGVVKIPSTLGGEPVIMIEDDVFNESGVTDIYFETEGMICIAPFAFAGCTTLSSVVIKGNEDTEIRDHAFTDCTNLTSIVFSEEINEFGGAAFLGTPWLENKKQETPLVIINNVVIDATLCTGDLVIPDGIIKIAGYAAEANENITSLTVSDSVQRIERGAFVNCTNLTRVSLPDGIHTISGQYGFAGSESIVITHRGVEYTYEQLQELDNLIWMEYLNNPPQ